MKKAPQSGNHGTTEQMKMFPEPNQTSSARMFEIDGWIAVMMVIMMV